MTTKKETAIAKKEETQISNEVMDLASEFSGSVNVRQNIIRIPIMKITNALSDAFKSRVADLGEFFCKATGENSGKKIQIIPLFISESASYLDKKTSKLICKSLDLKRNIRGEYCHHCPYNVYWNDWSNGAPDCKVSIDIVALIYRGPDYEYARKDLIQIGFRKMNHKAGANLVNLCSYDQRKVPFGSRYELVTKEDKRDNFDFIIVDPNAIKKEALTEEEIKKVLPIARELNEARKSGAMSVDEDHEEVSTKEEIPL